MRIVYTSHVRLYPAELGFPGLDVAEVGSVEVTSVALKR
jgi:hypothetical protein